MWDRGVQHKFDVCIPARIFVVACGDGRNYGTCGELHHQKRGQIKPGRSFQRVIHRIIRHPMIIDLRTALRAQLAGPAGHNV